MSSHGWIKLLLLSSFSIPSVKWLKHDPPIRRPRESVVESTTMYLHTYMDTPQSGAVPDRFPPLGTQWRLHHSLSAPGSRAFFGGTVPVINMKTFVAKLCITYQLTPVNKLGALNMICDQPPPTNDSCCV